MLRKFLILICLLLTSCGFHPRGKTALEPTLKNIYLQTPSPYDQLTRNLQQYLKMNGVYLAASPHEAQAVLQILSEVPGEVLTSISGTQQTRQYNLTFTVTFQVTDPNGRVLVPPQSVSQTRTVTIQASQMLGSSNEATAMYTQMRRAIVYDLMSRLASLDVAKMLQNAAKA